MPLVATMLPQQLLAQVMAYGWRTFTAAFVRGRGTLFLVTAKRVLLQVLGKIVVMVLLCYVHDCVRISVVTPLHCSGCLPSCSFGC